MSSSDDIAADMRDRARADLNRFREIAQSLAAGNKMPVDTLEWYITFAERHWFHRDLNGPEVKWRNKTHGTLYTFKGVTLRITDSEVSPVYLFVDYAPVDSWPVTFSREANEFLRKFEPVYEATVWQVVENHSSADRLPGAVA